MRLWHIAFLIGIILCVVIIWFFFVHSQPIKNTPITKFGPILVFGDSLVEGVGSTKGHDFPRLLAAGLGEPVLNFGVAGDTTQDGLDRLSEARKENPKLVILVLGGNDFLQKVPREQTFANLEKIIISFQSDGAAVMIVSVRSGIIGGGADSEYEAVAKKTGAAYEEDILKGVFGNVSLMSDAVHPNDAGYAKITERLLPEIRELLKK